MDKKWPSLSIDLVIQELESNPETGLSTSEAEKRLLTFGPNSLPAPKPRPLFSIFIHQFQSPLIYLLLLASCIAFFIDDKKDAIVILVVVLLNAIIGAMQEGRAEQSVLSLRKLLTIKARVLRDGTEQEIDASQVVPGDIISVSSGDAVSADSRLIYATSLAVAEAALTGESLPVIKSTLALPETVQLADCHNMIFAGTQVTAGRALAIVTATGMKNEIGNIAELTANAIQPKTQLELRLQDFGRYISMGSILLFFLVLGIGFLKNIPFSEIIMVAISQLVSLVPEGLPVAMTIALAVSVQRMAQRKTIVRRLSAVEILGSTTVICTDKTGTLTKNEMTATCIYLPAGHRKISVSGAGYKPEGEFTEDNEILNIKEVDEQQQLMKAVALCNDSQLLPPDRTNQNWRILGDPTEGALLTLAFKAGVDPMSLNKMYPRKAEIPFDSKLKLMATSHEVDGEDLVYVKGAPEAVLALTGSIDQPLNSIGLEEIPISTQQRDEITNAAKEMADSALRVLAVGLVRKATIDGVQGYHPYFGKVIFLGLIGELDPPRVEVAEAVRQCQKAGVRPVMVTGDHLATGLAIAKSLGLSQKDDTAIDGNDLDKMSQKELIDKIPRISVFARVHPAQKLRIIQAFQARGEVVAMTGDGVNDAPALVTANIGIAMGLTGTEVAKEAAKIIISDDNFSTIITAVSEGRLVYQNIKKLILFLLVTSIDEVIVLLLALIAGYPPPLAAVQILWINLVSEGALTVNLIMEPPEGNEMSRPPISIKEPLIDRELLLRMPLMLMASVISTFGWFTYRSSLGLSAEQVQTETFTILVVGQWFNVLNCRSANQSALSWSLFKNPYLLGGLIIANLMHASVIYWKPLAAFFHTVPIAPKEFFEIGAVASLVLWTEEIRKFFARRKILKAVKMELPD